MSLTDRLPVKHGHRIQSSLNYFLNKQSLLCGIITKTSRIMGNFSRPTIIVLNNISNVFRTCKKCSSPAIIKVPVQLDGSTYYFTKYQLGGWNIVFMVGQLQCKFESDILTFSTSKWGRQTDGQADICTNGQRCGRHCPPQCPSTRLQQGLKRRQLYTLLHELLTKRLKSMQIWLIQITLENLCNFVLPAPHLDVSS